MMPTFARWKLPEIAEGYLIGRTLFNSREKQLKIFNKIHFFHDYRMVRLPYLSLVEDLFRMCSLYNQAATAGIFKRSPWSARLFQGCAAALTLTNFFAIYTRPLSLGRANEVIWEASGHQYNHNSTGKAPSKKEFVVETIWRYTPNLIALGSAALICLDDSKSKTKLLALAAGGAIILVDKQFFFPSLTSEVGKLATWALRGLRMLEGNWAEKGTLATKLLCQLSKLVP